MTWASLLGLQRSLALVASGVHFILCIFFFSTWLLGFLRRWGKAERELEIVFKAQLYIEEIFFFFTISTVCQEWREASGLLHNYRNTPKVSN